MLKNHHLDGRSRGWFLRGSSIYIYQVDPNLCSHYCCITISISPSPLAFTMPQRRSDSWSTAVVLSLLSTITFSPLCASSPTPRGTTTSLQPAAPAVPSLVTFIVFPFTFADGVTAASSVQRRHAATVQRGWNTQLLCWRRHGHVAGPTATAGYNYHDRLLHLRSRTAMFLYKRWGNGISRLPWPSRFALSSLDVLPDGLYVRSF